MLQELQEVFASPHFCNSKRYPALLRFIVESTLAGRADQLKERTLGVEVFDRPPAYDTNADTIVRYTAGEVRKRLMLYYSEAERQPAIRISLPPGSYVPEFLHGPEPSHGPEAAPDSTPVAAEAGTPPLASQASAPVTEPARNRWRSTAALARHPWIMMASVAFFVAAAAFGWNLRNPRVLTTPDAFWRPLLHGQPGIVICTGGVVFAQGNLSGVTTAGKDIDYPFVSFQIASAITAVNGLLERGGAATQLLSSPSTPLNQLREHPVVLLGGYNNQWTLRLLQPLRFHFASPAAPSILDQQHPDAHWARDASLPYSSADDYALVARFRNTTTDSWVVALAGLGRNGTEAAAQFVTDPHYIQLLRDRVGSDFAARNIEVLLKVNVIDGKTGAPSVVAIHVW